MLTCNILSCNNELKISLIKLNIGVEFMIKLMGELSKGNTFLVILTLIFVTIFALDGIVYPYFAGALADTLGEGRFDELPVLLLFWLFMWILLAVGGIGQDYFFGKLRARILTRLKDTVFKRAYKPAYRKIGSDKFYAQITADTKQVETDFVNHMVMVVFCIAQSIITLVFLMTLNWQVGLVFVLLGFIPAIMPRFTSKWIQNSASDWQENNHKYLNYTNEGLNGRGVITRFNAIRFIKDETVKLLNKEQDKYFWMHFKQSLSSNGVFIVYSITMIGSIAYGAFQVYQGNLTVGMLITIMMAADRVTSPLVFLASIYNKMNAMVPILNKLLYGENAGEVIADPVFKDMGGTLLQLDNGAIGYDEPLVEDLNLSVEPRDKILIQGGSGTGKSTLLKTLMNEHEPLHGEVSYGKQLDDNIVMNFAAVEQRPFLFNQSIRYNLQLGNDISDDVLIVTLKNVGLDKYAHDKGLDIVIGDNNHRLSGGEMKRLEVARALVYGKDILVVDEALSGLDDTSARKLNDLIMRFPGAVINIEHHIPHELKEKYNKVVAL